MAKRQSLRDRNRVVARYRCRLLSDWADFIRTSPIFDPDNWEPRTEGEIHDIMDLIEDIDKSDADFPAQVAEDIGYDKRNCYSLEKARTARKQCLQALDHGNVNEARELSRFLEKFLGLAMGRETRINAAIGIDYSSDQSGYGKKGAAVRWQGSEARQLVDELIRSLANQTDALGDYSTPRELWPVFYGEMDRHHLDPDEAGPDEIRYGNSESIKFDAFRKRIERIRNKV